VPVPTQVTAAAIMEGKTAPHAGSHSAEVDTTCSAGATETQSSDTSRAYSAHVRCTESTQAADVASTEPARVASTEPARVASAKPAAAMTSATPTASTRLCAGCNYAGGERAGDENDHRLLQHFPTSFFLATACTAPIAIGTRWCAFAPVVFCSCRALLTVAAI
jgi:hypothetical protein